MASKISKKNFAQSDSYHGQPRRTDMAFRTDPESLSESGGKAGAYHEDNHSDNTQFDKTYVGLL